MMTYTIRWADGTTTTSTSPDNLLDRVAALQWAPTDRDGIRAALSDRAWVWAGLAVDPTLPADEFLTACAAVDLFDYTTTEV